MSSPKGIIKKSLPLSRAFKLIFGLLVPCLFFPFEGKANECRITPEAILPVDHLDFLPTVDVKINGHELIMGIDTGEPVTIVAPGTALKLDLPTAPDGKVLLNSLEVGNVERKKLKAAVASIPLKISGHQPLAGLIGADVLADYDIEYNPRRQLIYLYNVEDCSNLTPPWNGPYMRLPAIITPSNRIAIPVKLNGYLLSAVIDTGSSGFRLALDSAAKAGLNYENLASDPLTAISGTGSSSYKARWHHFEETQIGNEIFVGLHIQVYNFPSKETDMLIGENFIRSRRLWLSYATHAVFIQESYQQQD